MEKYYYKMDTTMKTWCAEDCHYQGDGTRIGSRSCASCERFLEEGTDDKGAWVKCKNIKVALGLIRTL